MATLRSYETDTNSARPETRTERIGEEKVLPEKGWKKTPPNGSFTICKPILRRQTIWLKFVRFGSRAEPVTYRGTGGRSRWFCQHLCDWNAKTANGFLHEASNWTDYLYENGDATYMVEKGNPQSHWCAEIRRGVGHRLQGYRIFGSQGRRRAHRQEWRRSACP